MTLNLAASGFYAAIVTFVLCLAAANGRLAFLPVAGVNDRSLHARPVRTAAGLAIVAGILTAWFIQSALSGEKTLWPVIFGATVLAATGLADDRRGLSARLRLGIQAAASAALLLWWERLSPQFHPLLFALLLLAVLWFLNLFNFMDGSDGLAASQTIVAAAPWLIATLTGRIESTPEVASTLMALIAACGAFLFFNWPKARLFMGDAGSLAIPFLIAGMVLLSPDPGAAGLLAAIGFAPFVTDATLTLAIRMAMRERWWQAHRSHAYQLLARRTGTHTAPLGLLWAYGLIWLMPLGLAASYGVAGPLAALVAAYVPVLAGCAVLQWRLREKFGR